MTEHVHDYGLRVVRGLRHAYVEIACRCGEELEGGEARRRLNEYDKLKRATEPTWVCEFCFACLLGGDLPADWDLVFQSAICPSCQKKVAQDGGYHNVPGGSYSDERKDPRAYANTPETP